MNLIDNKYARAYRRIINCYYGVSISRYSERHHIIPKSLGGSNSSDNIVRLPARAHFVAHMLLARCTTGDAKRRMVRALWRMCTGPSDSVRVTSRTYESVRAEMALIFAEQGRSLSKGNTHSIGNAWSRPDGEGIRARQSARSLARWADPSYRARMHESRSRSPKVQANIDRLARSKRGVPHSDQHRQKIRAATIDHLRELAQRMRGVPRSEEMRAKISAGRLRLFAKRRAEAGI